MKKITRIKSIAAAILFAVIICPVVFGIKADAQTVEVTGSMTLGEQEINSYGEGESDVNYVTLPDIKGTRGDTTNIWIDAYDDNASYIMICSSDTNIIFATFANGTWRGYRQMRLFLRFEGAGKADVRVQFYKYKDGPLSSEFKFNVTSEKNKSSVSGKSKFTKDKGTTFKLNQSITGDGKVTYKSSNKKVATVTKKGKVKCKSYGKAVITVKVKGTSQYTATTKKITVKVSPYAKPGTPSIGYWEQAEKPKNSTGDGFVYKISWKKVKGASGYQVVLSEKSSSYDRSWYSWKKNQTGTTAKIEFSELYGIRAKVRAYKVVKGKKIYGAWSDLRIKYFY